MKTTDTIFSLKISFMDEMRKSANYLQLADYIKQNGCFKINGLNVYNAELALIFMSKKLPAYNKATKKDTAINGGRYIESYRQGYIEGGNRFKEDFVKHFSYGNNAELYVRDIHWHFFHNECGVQQHEGWQFVKSYYPLLITHKAVKEFGYYSGIVSEVEVLVKQYPNLFKTFDKCDHKKDNENADAQNRNSENDTDELSNTVEKYLSPLQDAFRSNTDYKKAFQTIYSYFKNEKVKLNSSIFVRSRNIKKLCKALGCIHRDTTGQEFIGVKYLEFAKATFSCLSNQKIEKDETTNSTFYKYFKGKL